MRDMVSYTDSSMPSSDYPIYTPNPIAETYMQPMSYQYVDDRSTHMQMHEPTPPPARGRRQYSNIDYRIEGSPSYKVRQMKPRNTSDSGTAMSESARGPSVDVESADPDHTGNASFASGMRGVLQADV
jgi:hypothetical protein